MRRIVGFTVIAVLLVVAAIRGSGVVVGMAYLFRESGYPWWIQAPAAAALIILLAIYFKLRRRDWAGARRRRSG